MKKHVWYGVNIITGETFEAIEPITFDRFLKETGLGTRGYGWFLGRSQELVLERIEHVRLKNVAR